MSLPSAAVARGEPTLAAPQDKIAPSGTQALSRHTLDSPAFLTPTSGPTNVRRAKHRESHPRLCNLIIATLADPLENTQAIDRLGNYEKEITQLYK